MNSNTSDPEVKKLRKQLQEFTRSKTPALLEKAIEAETQGLSLLESLKKRREIAEQWQIATEKTTGAMSGFFEGLLGKDLGKILSKKYAKADDDQVKKAQDFFNKFKKTEDKKEKVSVKKREQTTKDFISIKKTVFDIQRDIKTIRKVMAGKSSPEVNPKYFFDERMSGGGRFKDKDTNKIVSKDVALKRSEGLAKAIAADEDPLVRIADTVDSIWKSLGPSTEGGKTLHKRLGELDSGGGGGGFGFPRFGILKSIGGVFGKVGGAIKNVGGRVAGAVGNIASKITGRAGLAAGEVAAKAAVAKTASKEVIEKVATKVLQSTALKTAGKSIPLIGAAVGGFFAVKKLLEGDKIGAGLEAVSGLGSAATAIPAAVASAARDVYQSVYGMFPEDDPESGTRFKQLKDVVTEVATNLISGKKQDDKTAGAPGKPPTNAAPVDTKIPTPTTQQQIAPAPKPPQETSFFEQAKINIQSAASSVGGAVSGAISSVKDFFGMGTSAGELGKYVRLKDSSVNIRDLNPQLKERLAGLAKEYYDQTGKKIQLNSGYRSPEEQAALFAKIGAPYAAPPGRSRHESGLAIDMNSPDANKAVELGLMAKYGFTRPVRGETWHVEPIESAKRGSTPDNPYKPGAPVAVANNGKIASPETGAKPAASIAPTSSSSMVAAQNQADAALASPSAPLSAQAATASMGLTPITSDLGSSIQQQSNLLASNQMAMQAPQPPVVINNSTPSQPNPTAGQKQTIPMANARPSDNSFMRALARDFAHPTAFTTISMI